MKHVRRTLMAALAALASCATAPTVFAQSPGIQCHSTYDHAALVAAGVLLGLVTVFVIDAATAFREIFQMQGR